MAANGFLNGRHRLSSEDEEIDLRDNKYLADSTTTTPATTTIHKRTCSDPDRDSIEDPESEPEDVLPERHQKKPCRQAYEEDMEVDEDEEEGEAYDNELEPEMAGLNEDSESQGEEDEDKDVGDEKGGVLLLVGGGDEERDYGRNHALDGMTSAEPGRVCAVTSGGGIRDSSSGGAGGGTDGGGAPHPDSDSGGSSVPAGDEADAVHAHSGGSSGAHRRSWQEEGQQSVIETPHGRSTSPERVPSYHHTQEVAEIEEGPLSPLCTLDQPAFAQNKEEQSCRSPEYTGETRSTTSPPASPTSSIPSSPGGHSSLQGVASPREATDSESAPGAGVRADEEPRHGDDEDGDGCGALTGGFLDYLGSRMERSNSTELEKRDEEKGAAVDADAVVPTMTTTTPASVAIGAASGETDADATDKNADPEGKTCVEASHDDDDKDVDTAAAAVVVVSVPEKETADSDNEAGENAENAAAVVEESEEEEGATDDKPLEKPDTADRCADVDAADKDVTDEKEERAVDKPASDAEEEDGAMEQDSNPEADATLVDTTTNDSAEAEQQEGDDKESEGEETTDAGARDTPCEEEHEVSVPEQTQEEPEVADRPDSPAEAAEVVAVEEKEEKTKSIDDDDETADKCKTSSDDAPEVSSPAPVAASPDDDEEVEEPQESAAPVDDHHDEITQPEPTAKLDAKKDEEAFEAEDSAVSAAATPAVQEEDKEETPTLEEQEPREDTETAENASDEEQPTFIEHPSPTADEPPQVQEEAAQEEEEQEELPAQDAQSNLRSGATGSSPRTPPGDITRADDKLDDGIESVQSISNIKTRFQSRDEKPPMPGDSMTRSQRSSVSPSNGHVNGDHTPPEVVNRSASQEDILGRELPPVNMARSLASKFRDLESSESSPNADRKPVRKITPPREDVERDVSSYRESMERREDVVRSEDAYEKQDERPPPSFTKNMLAKFKEMEDTQKPPPSPGRAATSPTKRTHRPVATHTYMKSSPDEGIADTEPVNGHGGGQAVRESDKNETEEMPERGFTKSLVSQWRQIEQTAGGSSKSPLAPRHPGANTPAAARNATTYRHASPANSESEEQREVVRESDNYDEDSLPPPSYTKNMLAKFQSMQQEAQKDPATTPTKKQFKWTVNETKPLWAAPTAKDELQLQSVNGHDEAPSSDEEEVYCEDDLSLECDAAGNPLYPLDHPRHPDNVRRRKEERQRRKAAGNQQVVRSDDVVEDLPAPETTKKLLSRFKSMEDVAALPPTPETSVQRQRSVRSSYSGTSSARQSTSSMESREQPDGIETTDNSVDHEDSPGPLNNVIRETDTDVGAELPEQGTTRNLLARFQSMQAV